MSLLNSIEQRVQEGLAANHHIIVSSVFAHLVKKHNKNGYCDCDYCQKLPEYVRAIRHARHLVRSLDDEWRGVSVSYNAVLQAKLRVLELKKQKDALKRI